MEHTGTTATPDVPSIPLTDSVSIPQVGFGVFQISASTTQQAVEQALEIGYRHIDTAAAYYNEREVGDALKATGMTGKVFVTSKLRNCDQGYDAARVALDTTLNNLGLDHLDLYLIHWPFPAVDQYVETWKGPIIVTVCAKPQCIFCSTAIRESAPPSAKPPLPTPFATDGRRSWTPPTR